MEKIGNRANLTDRLLKHVFEVSKGRLRGRRQRFLDAAGDQGRRDEVLAGTVVQIARDSPPLLVLRPHQRGREPTRGALGGSQLVDQRANISTGIDSPVRNSCSASTLCSGSSPGNRPRPCKVAQVRITATTRMAPLAPLSPNRTAAHRTRGNGKKRMPGRKLVVVNLPAAATATIQTPTSATASTAGSMCRREGFHRVHLAPSENQIRNTGPSVRLGSAFARYQWDQKIQ